LMSRGDIRRPGTKVSFRIEMGCKDNEEVFVNVV
jgi:hypothetical protein